MAKGAFCLAAWSFLYLINFYTLQRLHSGMDKWHNVMVMAGCDSWIDSCQKLR